MPFSIYQASVPVFDQYLNSLSAVLSKAAANAEARKIDPQVFLTARLAPDMFPLLRQVQVATDHAKGAVGRLAGSVLPSFPDAETNFAELQTRIAKTRDYVKTFTSAQLEGSESRPIELKIGPNTINFVGHVYLCQFALPNFFFHYAAAYGILRHLGVDVGKRDFIGSF